MALPAGVTSCTITKSPPRDVLYNAGTITGATAKADRDLVWAATGETLYGTQEIDLTPVGDGLSFQLPHVDQPGFLDANTGQPVTNWYYTIVVSIGFGARRQSDTYRLQVLTGQATVDLDALPRQGTVLPSVTAPSAGVTSVAGKTGAVTASDLQAAVGNTGGSGVPTTRTINGQPLSSDVTLSAADVSAVPTTRTVAGKPLSANVTLAKADVGLANVDNTADTAKPVSTLQQNAVKSVGPFGWVIEWTGTAWPTKASLVPAWWTGKICWKADSTALTAGSVPMPPEIAIDDKVMIRSGVLAL